MSRTVLLIDDDLQFYGQLCQQLANYDFEIHQADLADESLDSAQELIADLLIIAVDLPDKLGFALCHKAKKMVSAPVILKTNTIPPEGFEKHSRLKSHADAYIDERQLTSEKLLATVDRLIGLGDAFEVEDLEMDEIEIDDFEAGGFDEDPSLQSEFLEESTKVASSSPFIDPTLEAETDAAFAALGFDDDKPARSFDTSDINDAGSSDESPFQIQTDEVTVVAGIDVVEAAEAEADGDPDEGFELIGQDDSLPPVRAGTQVAVDDGLGDDVSEGLALGSTPGYELELDEDDASAAADAVPVTIEAPAPAGLSLEGLADDDLKANELEVEELSSSEFERLDEVTAYGKDKELQAPRAEEFDADLIEVTTKVDDPDDDEAVEASALPLRVEDQPGPAPIDDVEEPVVEVEAGASEPEALAEDMHDADLDLGLDAIAERAQEESHAASQIEPAQLTELAAENARLKSELAAAKSAGSSSSSEFSREHEFLDLREKINKKEKALLDAQDRLTAKDRSLLDSKDKLSQLERSHSELDEKNLKLEHEILRAKEQQSAAAETLKASEKALTSAKETHEQAIAAAAQAQKEELSALAARQEQELSKAKSEHAAAQAAAIEALQEEHEAKIAQLESAKQAALAQAAAKLSEELAASHAASEQRLAEQVATSSELLASKEDEQKLALEQALSDFAQQKQGLADQHAGKFSRLERESEEARAELEAQSAQALEEAKAEFETAWTTAKEQEEEALAEAEKDKEAALLAAAEAHSEAIAAAAEGHETAMREALAAADAQRKQELEVAAQNLQSLDQRRREELNAAAEERDASESQLLAKANQDRAALEQEHSEMVDRLEADSADLKTALSSSRDKIAQIEHELTDTHAQVEELTSSIESKDQIIALRDDRLAALKGEIAELEEQNASYQEQVLKAYQKIKADAHTVERAKKAMAIALTLLDESADLGVDTDAPEDLESESVS